jgi:small subunit ribosomal protein S11
MAYVKKNKKSRLQVETAKLHIKSTFNNTLVTVTTLSGDVLFRSSAGRLNYKGTRKGTPYAASQVGAALTKDMQSVGIKNLEVNMQGIGSGRESVVRTMQGAGFNITTLADVTPLAHGGCRAPKRRRV